jgi:hypothetical protein
VKRRAILVVGVLAAGLALARAGATPAPAPGGVKLLEAIESSPRTVVGEIRKPKQLDHRGWVAEFVVETSLVKPDGASDAAFAVAWEEKVAPRPVRFRHGDRVLVSLTPLPDWSLWRQRLPDPEVRARTFAVAHRGDAFLRRPRLGSVSLLEHFVRLSPAERDSDVGVGILARLAEGAELPLAHSAIERLARVPSLDEALDAGPARSLVAALVRPDADDTLTRTWIELAARRRPAALRPPLEAELAAAGDGLAPAALYAALGAITDGLSGETLAFLLEHGPAEHRVAAASRAAGPEAPAALRKLLRRDPEPAVRMAAVKRLAALEGSRALEPAARALDDPDNRVRLAAADVLAGMGAEALPRLQRAVEDGPAPAAQAAVAGLSQLGTPESRAALREIAQTHPDRGIRTLARIAVGMGVGHVHE